MRLSQLVEEYFSLLNQSDDAKSERIKELKAILMKEGISIQYEEDRLPLQHVLTLPVPLDELNRLLNFPKDEYIRDGEFLYLPPAKIVDFIDGKDCYAAEIHVKERRGHTEISCEGQGHALGFLRAYVQSKSSIGSLKPTL